MKQLSMLDEILVQDDFENKNFFSDEVVTWRLFVDGASRNNPGPSGAGFCVEKNNKIVDKRGFFLGIKTNNQAEYLALLLGIFFLEPLVSPSDVVEIIADSELLVKQLNGLYKIKNDFLQILHRIASKEIHKLNARLSHTLRIGNKEADAMANKGLDLKISPPPAFVENLAQYGVLL